MNREHVVGCPALRAGVRCTCQIVPSSRVKPPTRVEEIRRKFPNMVGTWGAEAITFLLAENERLRAKSDLDERTVVYERRRAEQAEARVRALEAALRSKGWLTEPTPQGIPSLEKHVRELPGEPPAKVNPAPERDLPRERDEEREDAEQALTERDAARAEVERLKEVLRSVDDVEHSEAGEIVVTRHTMKMVRDAVKGHVVPEGFWGRSAARALTRAIKAEDDLARLQAALETAANRLDIAASVIRSGAKFARWADEARAALEGRG